MVSGELLKEFGFEEEVYEVINDSFLKTGYPKSEKRYELRYEIEDLSVEEPYYWVLDLLQHYYPTIDKVEDSFSASENSAFFGVTQQRLGLQQDKVGQYLATVGKMVKELFQMVRELRIIDERREYYGGAEKEIYKPLKNRKNADEITLKGMFVDLVQGGGKSPSSVFGMAAQLEFVALPDLFFDAPPFKSVVEMEDYVDGLTDFNSSLLRVMKRHLRQFMEWKKRTRKEHENRRQFQLRYLRQHFDIIQMYVTWMKPYLKTVQRLHLKEKHQDSARLISAFESSMIDIEIIAHHPEKTHCVMCTFQYRTRPHMKFVQDGYQRGPVHVGELDMQIRVYPWNKEQIKKYKKMKEKENLELIGDVSQSVLASMKGLGRELERYYEEACGLDLKKKLEEKGDARIAKKKDNRSLKYKLFGDFLPPPKKSGSAVSAASKKLGDGAFSAHATAWGAYHFFKKAHRMITW
ncbi:hypothetical protein CL619_04650 [archaeon]|nr:hypothetical protein [archaeon]|tara:strand:- start:5877 stop:7268 length:1392 start_codon:yes stop_codon:yes gene_type:complete